MIQSALFVDLMTLASFFADDIWSSESFLSQFSVQCELRSACHFVRLAAGNGAKRLRRDLHLPGTRHPALGAACSTPKKNVIYCSTVVNWRGACGAVTIRPRIWQPSLDAFVFGTDNPRWIRRVRIFLASKIHYTFQSISFMLVSKCQPDRCRRC